MGKRGGARVVYFNEFEGQIWLLIVYAKAKFDNLPAEFLAQLKYEVEHGQVKQQTGRRRNGAIPE